MTCTHAQGSRDLCVMRSGAPARLACSPRLLASSARLVCSPRLLASSARLVLSPRLLASPACLVFSPRLLASSAHLDQYVSPDPSLSHTPLCLLSLVSSVRLPSSARLVYWPRLLASRLLTLSARLLASSVALCSAARFGCSMLAPASHLGCRLICSPARLT